MFENNKYTKWYYLLIKNAKERKDIPVIIEKHHILPKSLGGDNTNLNIVSLSPREHFLAHLLLTKMTKNENKKKMIFALHCMAFLRNENRSVLSSREYNIARKSYKKMAEDGFLKRSVLSEKQIKASKEHSKKMSGSGNPMYGKKKPEETKKKQSETRKLANYNGKRNSFYGKKHSEETRNKMSKMRSEKKLRWITDGLNNKMISFNENIPLGYYFGQTKNKKQ